MRHKTRELEGALLDAAVAMAEGWSIRRATPDGFEVFGEGALPLPFGSWSRDWAKGGPIIEREEIELRRATFGGWHAGIGLEDHHERAGIGSFGPEPLIAAMRAYVSSTLGEEVELP